jgi:hypothetical protein
VNPMLVLLGWPMLLMAMTGWLAMFEPLHSIPGGKPLEREDVE